MSKVTIFVFILICFLCLSELMAQRTTHPAFHGSPSDFPSYLYNELGKRVFAPRSGHSDSATNAPRMTPVCTKATGTIQLYFSRKRKIAEVIVTGKCPDALKNTLVDISIPTASLWELPKECYPSRKRNGVPLVIPYFIHIANGCKEVHNDPYYLNGRGFGYGVFLHSAPIDNKPMLCYLFDPLYLVNDDSAHELNPLNQRK